MLLKKLTIKSNSFEQQCIYTEHVCCYRRMGCDVGKSNICNSVFCPTFPSVYQTFPTHLCTEEQALPLLTGTPFMVSSFLLISAPFVQFLLPLLTGAPFKQSLLPSQLPPPHMPSIHIYLHSSRLSVTVRVTSLSHTHTKKKTTHA